jgi:excisionase family DNA binding protein
MTSSTTGFSDRLAVGIMEAARLAGVGRSTIYQSISAGDLAARKAGRRTLILRDDLEAWLNSFPRIKSMPESTRR